MPHASAPESLPHVAAWQPGSRMPHAANLFIRCFSGIDRIGAISSEQHVLPAKFAKPEGEEEEAANLMTQQSKSLFIKYLKINVTKMSLPTRNGNAAK